MICKKCKTKMKMGIAIDPKYDQNARYIMPVGNLNSDTLELIDVWKCPKCGHSEKVDNFKEGAPTGMTFKMKRKK